MKNIIYTLLILLMANTVLAQTGNEITPPAEDETIVGAIGGTADLSALGGATYTIPIKVPDGINGVQPNLSIVYNSQSGNGLLGWGWNLGGLSAITRVGQTKYHDGNVCGVSYDFHDRYALDGQRLFSLDAASYGGNGTEYRTETDGMSKIVSYKTGLYSDGPDYFTVTTADGMIMEYGKAETARVIFHHGSTKAVAIWLLNRIEDRSGNYMVYNYSHANNGHSYRIENIQYCANSNIIDQSEEVRGTKYGVDFHYAERRDKEVHFIGAFELTQPWLL